MQDHNGGQTERRHFKRRHLIYYLRVFNRKTGDLLGHLVDVTRDGIMLINEDHVPLDIEMDLRMSLPEEISGKVRIELGRYATIRQ